MEKGKTVWAVRASDVFAIEPDLTEPTRFSLALIYRYEYTCDASTRSDLMSCVNTLQLGVRGALERNQAARAVASSTAVKAPAAAAAARTPITPETAQALQASVSSLVADATVALDKQAKMLDKVHTFVSSLYADDFATGALERSEERTELLAILESVTSEIRLTRGKVGALDRSIAGLVVERGAARLSSMRASMPTTAVELGVPTVGSSSEAAALAAAAAAAPVTASPAPTATPAAAPARPVVVAAMPAPPGSSGSSSGSSSASSSSSSSSSSGSSASSSPARASVGKAPSGPKPRLPVFELIGRQRAATDGVYGSFDCASVVSTSDVLGVVQRVLHDLADNAAIDDLARSVFRALSLCHAAGDSEAVEHQTSAMLDAFFAVGLREVTRSGSGVNTKACRAFMEAMHRMATSRADAIIDFIATPEIVQLLLQNISLVAADAPLALHLLHVLTIIEETRPKLVAASKELFTLFRAIFERVRAGMSTADLLCMLALASAYAGQLSMKTLLAELDCVPRLVLMAGAAASSCEIQIAFAKFTTIMCDSPEARMALGGDGFRHLHESLKTFHMHAPLAVAVLEAMTQIVQGSDLHQAFYVDTKTPQLVFDLVNEHKADEEVMTAFSALSRALVTNKDFRRSTFVPGALACLCQATRAHQSVVLARHVMWILRIVLGDKNFSDELTECDGPNVLNEITAVVRAADGPR